MRKGYRRLLLALLAGWLLGAFSVKAFHLSPLVQPLFRNTHQWMEEIRYRDWPKETSEHFMLYYQEADQHDVQLILREAEQIYHHFRESYGFAPQEKVVMVLFPHREGMAQRFGWKEGPSATGVYYGGVIYLLSPSAWLYPAYFTAEMRAELFHQQGPLYHEYTHLYLDVLANNNFPRWYTEGLAQWEEYENIGFEWVVPENNLQTQTLYTLEDLTERFDQLDNLALAYRQAFSLVRYMVQREGEEALQELHQRLAERVPFEAAWRQTFGETVRESFDAWMLLAKGGRA